MTPPVLLQITDTHLFADPNGELHKMNTLNSLNRVLDFICRNEGQIDCLIATGDIAVSYTHLTLPTIYSV